MSDWYPLLVTQPPDVPYEVVGVEKTQSSIGGKKVAKKEELSQEERLEALIQRANMAMRDLKVQTQESMRIKELIDKYIQGKVDEKVGKEIQGQLVELRKFFNQMSQKAADEAAELALELRHMILGTGKYASAGMPPIDSMAIAIDLARFLDRPGGENIQTNLPPEVEVFMDGVMKEVKRDGSMNNFVKKKTKERKGIRG